MMQIQKIKQGYKLVKSFPKYIILLIPTEWDFVAMKEILVKQNSGFHNRLERTEEGDNIVGMVDLYHNTKIDGQKFLLAKFPFQEKEQYLLKSGDLIYVEISLVRSGVGKTLYVTKNGAGTYFAGNTRRFEVNEKCEPVFLYYLLNTEFFRNSMINRSYTSALTGITTKDYFGTKIPLPPIREQQSIATILSNIDSLIQQTQKEIERTTLLKNGLMQKLLTKGIGHSEFKKTEIGEIPIEWKIDKLGNVSTLFIPMRNKPKEFGGTIPWIRIEDFDGKYIAKSKSNQNVSKETVASMLLRVYPKGTVLCTCSGASIGKYAVTVNELVTNQTFIGIYPNSNLDTEFFYYFITTQTNNLKKISTGTTLPYISREKFESFLIPMPNLEEQKKIALIFLNVDSLIEKQKQIKSNLENLKKGLMQKLLTGQIRVKI